MAEEFQLTIHDHEQLQGMPHTEIANNQQERHMNMFIRQKAEETDRQGDKQTNKQTTTQSYNIKEMTKNE